METAVEKNIDDPSARFIQPKDFVIQLGKRIDKVTIVRKNDYEKVFPNGWIEKQTWREINDILRLNGFSWISNGRDGCWLKPHKIMI